MEDNSIEHSRERFERDAEEISVASDVPKAPEVANLGITSEQKAQAELVTLWKAVEKSGEVIFLTDPDGLITYVNPEFTRLYGYEFLEVVGRTTPRILKSGLMTSEDYQRFWQALLNKQTVKGKFINRSKGGRFVTVEGSANPILDEREAIVGFLAIQRDVTQRDRTEGTIREQNRELAALYAIATTVSQSLDLNQILNQALDEVLQLDIFSGMAKGMVFRLDEKKEGLVPIAHRGAPENHPCLKRPLRMGECLCGLAAQQGEVIISEDWRGDSRHSRQWPEMPGHKDICLPLNVRGEVLGVMNVRLPPTHKVETHDVDLLTTVADQIGVAIENARLFEEVSKQHERLRTLSSRLAEVEESERRRLAQELHDRVGRKLTALGINMNLIRNDLPVDGLEGIRTRLDESQTLLEETARLIRGVMSDLHPPTLDDLGLVDTLHWYGDQFASRTGLTVAVRGDEPAGRMPTNVENALFRIAQESLTNVAKHAQATEVRITVESDDKTARMIVADDGIGCNPDRLDKPGRDGGWGLLIMVERAQAVGGRCWIESRSDEGGTRVITEVPR